MLLWCLQCSTPCSTRSLQLHGHAMVAPLAAALHARHPSRHEPSDSLLSTIQRCADTLQCKLVVMEGPEHSDWSCQPAAFPARFAAGQRGLEAHQLRASAINSGRLSKTALQVVAPCCRRCQGLGRRRLQCKGASLALVPQLALMSSSWLHIDNGDGKRVASTERATEKSSQNGVVVVGWALHTWGSTPAVSKARSVHSCVHSKQRRRSSERSEGRRCTLNGNV